MEWSKKSSLLSVLLVAVIGALTLTHYNGFSDESQYSSSSVRSIIEYSRIRSGFGPEFEYRVNGASVSGMSKRGSIGLLYTSVATGRRPLRVFVNPSNSNERKYSVVGPAAGYTRYLGVAGFCAVKSGSGLTPFVQLSKLNTATKRTEYAYATSKAKYLALRKVGYGSPKLFCYVKAVSSSSPPFRPVIEWSRVKPGFGTEFEYRVTSATVSGFSRRGVIGLLSTSMASGRKTVRVFANSAGGRKYSTTGAAPGYTRYIGVAGYCQASLSSGYTAFVELRKGSEYAYATSKGKYDYLRKIGYGFPKLLCYIKAVTTASSPSSSPSNPPVVRISKFERNVGSYRYFEYGRAGLAKPVGYVYRGVMPVILPGRPLSGYAPIRMFYNPRTRDSQLWTGGVRKKDYTQYRGILAYCSTSRRSSIYLPIYKFGRYLSNGYPRDNAYTVIVAEGRAFIQRGFKYEGVLCYARKA